MRSPLIPEVQELLDWVNEADQDRSFGLANRADPWTAQGLYDLLGLYFESCAPFTNPQTHDSPEKAYRLWIIRWEQIRPLRSPFPEEKIDKVIEFFTSPDPWTRKDQS